MSQFDDIRPYNDNEVRPTINRLLNDPEFIVALCRLKFPKATSWLRKAMNPLVRRYLVRQTAEMASVYDLQVVVEKYMKRMIDSTIDELTVSGLEHLQVGKPYLFVSNHRDIVLDPALVNWVLFHNDHGTVNIAIGDNLLTKPYIEDLMRLNKSFIVNRSATAPREKLKVAKHLSAYIHYCINKERSNVWIAQREGRAKNGVDSTNSAVVSMLTLNKPKQMALASYVHQLNIVPVSISYEWDPCDFAKANELYINKTSGNYEKEEQEDAVSIAKGITGQKGHVHIAFGNVLSGSYQTTDDVVAELDSSIVGNYVLHPSNCLAYQHLHGELPSAVTVTGKSIPFSRSAFKREANDFTKRLNASDAAWRSIWLDMYANPVVGKY